MKNIFEYDSWFILDKDAEKERKKHRHRTRRNAERLEEKRRLKENGDKEKLMDKEVKITDPLPGIDVFLGRETT